MWGEGSEESGEGGGAGKVWACIGAPRILQAFGQREGKDLEGAGRDWACIGAPRILQAFEQREGKDLAELEAMAEAKIWRGRGETGHALEPLEYFRRLGSGKAEIWRNLREWQERRGECLGMHWSPLFGHALASGEGFSRMGQGRDRFFTSASPHEGGRRIFMYRYIAVS